MMLQFTGFVNISAGWDLHREEHSDSTPFLEILYEMKADGNFLCLRVGTFSIKTIDSAVVYV